MVKFGTGGWRAIIGDTFIKDNIIKVAQGLANKMMAEQCHNRGIVIGYDKRFLSDKSARWLAEVFAGNGIPVNFIERVSPTPLIMYAVKSLGTNYGIAVTASHNPADYNGLKVFTKGGKDADVAITEAIEAQIDAMKEVRHIDFEEAKAQGIIRLINPFNDYIDTIVGMLDVESIRNKELKILLDPMYGVSKTSLQTLLMTARCEVDTIHDSHDTSFGGRMPSPSEETLNHLANMVTEKGYDLGIGTDGDADRLGIIDEEGRYIHPNKIMVLLYYYLLRHKNWRGDVVRNIATTHQLDAIAKDFDQTCHEVPVGFKHISGKMNETSAIIGGESSGGLTIKGHVKGKDGIFAAGLLVEMISVTGKRLGAMVAEIDDRYGSFEMAEANFSFSPSEKDRLIKCLMEDKQIPIYEKTIERVSYLDGMKIYFDNGDWIITRFSGTEPLLRVFAESRTIDEAQACIETMREFLGL